MFWVEVLNRALEWRDTDAVAREPHAGQAARVLPVEVLGGLRDDVALLRHLFAASYLARPLSVAQAQHLEQWLAAVTLRPGRPIHEPGRMNPARAAELPILRASRAPAARPEPFETLLSTALVRLVGDLDEPEVMTAVHRCHGVVRRPRVSLETGWSPQLDEVFARKARCLALVRDGSMQQCERLVVSERGSRYCGKACSNAAFVARKSRNDPKYFAEKQRRYRQRKESRPREQAARVESGAFVYID